MVKCNQCGGTGEVIGISVQPTGIKRLPCFYCNGTGLVSDNHPLWKAQGKIIEQWINENDMTLREASRKLGVDASNLYKAAAGYINPSFAITKIKEITL